MKTSVEMMLFSSPKCTSCVSDSVQWQGSKDTWNGPPPTQNILLIAEQGAILVFDGFTMMWFFATFTPDGFDNILSSFASN